MGFYDSVNAWICHTVKIERLIDSVFLVSRTTSSLHLRTSRADERPLRTQRVVVVVGGGF